MALSLAALISNIPLSSACGNVSELPLIEDIRVLAESVESSPEQSVQVGNASDAKKELKQAILRLITNHESARIADLLESFSPLSSPGAVIYDTLLSDEYYLSAGLEDLAVHFVATLKWYGQFPASHWTRGSQSAPFDSDFFRKQLGDTAKGMLQEKGVDEKITQEEFEKRDITTQPLEWLESRYTFAKGKVDAATEELLNQGLQIIHAAQMRSKWTMRAGQLVYEGQLPGSSNSVQVPSPATAKVISLHVQSTPADELITPSKWLLWTLVVLVGVVGVAFFIKRKTEG